VVITVVTNSAADSLVTVVISDRQHHRCFLTDEITIVDTLRKSMTVDDLIGVARHFLTFAAFSACCCVI